MDYNILVINPGSTSEDIGYYRGTQTVFEQTVRYSPKDLDFMSGLSLSSQMPLRKNFILAKLAQHSIDLAEIDAVAGRGGLLKPIEGGVYEVNEDMALALISAQAGSHPSNLGGILAKEIAALSPKAKAFIADPVVIDELQPLARYTGLPYIKRKSIFHALNQKRVARLAAKELGKEYEDCSLIVMHAGGGITVGAHKNGKVIDVNNGYDGTGPITPQRSGTLPAADFVEFCLSGTYTRGQIADLLHGKGGIYAYTGISDVKALLEYAGGAAAPEGLKEGFSQEQAKELIDAMIYTIAKEIGSQAVVLKGRVDAIVLSGGLTYSGYITEQIKSYTSFITDKFFIYKGGDEKAALRAAAQSALEKPGSVKIYK